MNVNNSGDGVFSSAQSSVGRALPHDIPCVLENTALTNGATFQGVDEFREIANILDACGQSHLLTSLIRATAEDRANAMTVLLNTDWNELRSSIEHARELKTASPDTWVDDISAAPVVRLEDPQRRDTQIIQAGAQAYADGEVAVLIVAGGQATRLGWGEGLPKGCFPIGPVSEKSLFQIFSEQVAMLSDAHRMPLLIMTGPSTDGNTRNFFEHHRNFGLSESQVRIFKQGELPTLDEHGRAVLDSTAAPSTRLLVNPDGHGGVIKALLGSGNLERLKEEGIKHVLYIQVDNPLAPLYDPFLIGQLASGRCDMVTKVVAKRSPEERVGNLVTRGGTQQIIEYSELPAHVAERRTADGQLVVGHGNTGLHGFSLEFLSTMAFTRALPLHIAEKKITGLLPLDDGHLEVAKGYKGERFIFGSIPHARAHLGVEVSRDVEFAPIKNGTGADSPQTAQELMTALHTRWCTDAGITVAPGVRVEVSPTFALNRDAFLEKVSAGALAIKHIDRDMYIGAVER